MTAPLELQLPSLPEFVGTARLFIGDVGRHFKFSEDSVSDLKVAVSEACTAAILAQGDGGRVGSVRVAVEPANGVFSVEVTGAAGFGPPVEPPGGFSDFDTALGIGLVMALFPDASLKDTQSGTTLRLSIAPDSTAS